MTDRHGSRGNRRPPEAGSKSRQAALRARALQLLPYFLALPAPAKQPIMDAVAKVVEDFPVSSREAEGTTQHKAYLAQLFALFDALWGAADKAYDFIAVLEVCKQCAQLRPDTSSMGNFHAPIGPSTAAHRGMRVLCCVNGLSLPSGLPFCMLPHTTAIARADAAAAAGGDGH